MERESVIIVEEPPNPFPLLRFGSIRGLWLTRVLFALAGIAVNVGMGWIAITATQWPMPLLVVPTFGAVTGLGFFMADRIVAMTIASATAIVVTREGIVVPRTLVERIRNTPPHLVPFDLIRGARVHNVSEEIDDERDLSLLELTMSNGRRWQSGPKLTSELTKINQVIRSHLPS